MIPIINSDNKTDSTLIARKKLFFAKENIASVSFYDGKRDDSYEIKSLISDIFYRSYKAVIKVGFPNLLAVVGTDKTIYAAVGFRDAGVGELFLEQYLDDKIENIVSKIAGEDILRSEIVEIGSLASQKKGMAKFLYIAIASYLNSQKYRYVVATGTEFLQQYFKKAGLKPVIIADAKRELLKDQSVDWGNYYDSNPKVMVLNVKSGYGVLKLFLGIKVVPSFEKLYPHLSYE
jgi:hypothetical protein